jgi:hypothetical protein
MTDQVSPESNARWQEVTQKGRLPGPLSHHSMVYYKNHLYVFGGNRPNGSTNDQMFVFDLALSRWELQKTVSISNDNRMYSPVHNQECATNMLSAFSKTASYCLVAMWVVSAAATTFSCTFLMRNGGT